MEQRKDEVRAVMDKNGSQRAVLLGFPEGALMSALFAATYPERVSQLILFGGFARFADLIGAESIEKVLQRAVKLWGTGATIKLILPSQGMPVTNNTRRQAVKSIAKLTKGITIIALTTLIGHAPALAGTFVYLSNADEGDIWVYSGQTDGSLKPGERGKAANLSIPLAVSPDRRVLY